MHKPSQYQEAICIYCGADHPETVDHVPPACLFRDLPNPNLISVPCCLRCNQSFSRDDEYFKNMLALRRDIAENPIHTSLVNSIIRGLRNPKKQGMLRALQRTIRKVPLHTQAGIYLGQVPAYDVDLQRLGKVVNRIVKGLFYKENGICFPSTYDVRSFEESGFDNPNAETLKGLGHLILMLNGRPVHVVHPDVFQFRFVVSRDDKFVTAWILQFFRAVTFMSISTPVEATDAAP